MACHWLCITCNFGVKVTCQAGLLNYNIFPLPDLGRIWKLVCISPANITFPFLWAGEKLTCVWKSDGWVDMVITQNTPHWLKPSTLNLWDSFFSRKDVDWCLQHAHHAVITPSLRALSCNFLFTPVGYRMFSVSHWAELSLVIIFCLQFRLIKLYRAIFGVALISLDREHTSNRDQPMLFSRLLINYQVV